MLTSRRRFLGGLSATIAAPAVTRTGMRMPVRVIPDFEYAGLIPLDGRMISVARYPKLFAAFNDSFGSRAGFFSPRFRLPDFGLDDPLIGAVRGVKYFVSDGSLGRAGMLVEK